MSSLFHASLFHEHNFILSQLKHLTLNTTMSREFQNVVYQFFNFKIDGEIFRDLTKFQLLK